MLGFIEAFENRRDATQSRCVAAIFLLVLGIIVANPGRAQSQAQNAGAIAPEYKFAVASIKPSKSVYSRWGDPPDGFVATGVTLRALIQSAYHITGDYGLSGGPSWLNSETYDVEAKMENDIADAVTKLSKDDQNLMRQHMLQALLADRFGLVLHRETKELPVYTLVIAKNGPKLQLAKPGDAYPNGIKLPIGTQAAGVWVMRAGVGGSFTITAQAISLASLLPQLAFNAGRPVLDKTGLKGTYDFTLTYSLDQNQAQPSGNAPTGQPSPAPPDPSGSSLFTAVQEQLGLKLEAGKGPVEIIMIDHAERPSGN